MTTAFLVSTLVVAIAEIGDKTQIATVVLAAQYQALVAVVLGTTLGMMIANVPAVLVGRELASRIRLDVVRKVAAGLFFVTALLALLGTG